MDKIYDVLIIGGGINGCGIARDLAGRGIDVCLVEKNDLASATSSASTKLFHGGLRYLEYLEFKLVKAALEERETLLKAMPHISWPMRFIVPHNKDLVFEPNSPVSKLLGAFFPWLKGTRPAWIIRMGLFLYDHLGGRKILPATSKVDFSKPDQKGILDRQFTKAYEYSDCWVDDARLVVLNARDARLKGASILTRTTVTDASVDNGIWSIKCNLPDGTHTTIKAKSLVNAAGPWAIDIVQNKIGLNTSENIRPVRGSHIIVPKLYEHDKAYFLQIDDGRIFFIIPYEQDFTVIGTTDVDHENIDERPICSENEKNYLIKATNEYFQRQIKKDDIVWTYSGVRPLYDDGAEDAASLTRDYTIKRHDGLGAPMINIFGGKITTYRVLAEKAIDKIAPDFPNMKAKWTASAALPGGDFPVDGFVALIARLKSQK